LSGSIARVGEQPIDRKQIEEDVQGEMSGRVAAAIMRLASGESDTASFVASSADEAASPQADGNGAVASAEDYMAPWIDTAECTSCDECIRLNPNIFEYNEKKKAVIRDAHGGPYKDLVKAAERCTAGVIHPGLPGDRTEKDIAKWIARAERFNK